MAGKKLAFSEQAQDGIRTMRENVMQMFTITRTAFLSQNRQQLHEIDVLENNVDGMKKDLIARHFARLAEGNCSVDVSPYYSSVIVGLERVADHLVNVAYSIDNPLGDQNIE